MSNETNCVACDESPGVISMQSSGLMAKMFNDVTGLSVQLHSTICKACQAEVKNFYSFKKRCHDIAGLYNAESIPKQDKSTSKQELLSEITIVKNEPGFGQFRVDFNPEAGPEDEDYEFEETNASIADDDESITSYSLPPGLMSEFGNDQEANDVEIKKPTKFNQINAKAEIIFTAAEVNERVFSEGYPPVWRLLPKNHVPIPGKIPYSELLCEKISAIMPNKSQVSVHNGFTLFGGTTRAYIRCKHATKMPASFQQSELKENKPLKIKVILKCQECVDEAVDQETVIVPSSSTTPKSDFSKFKSIFHKPNSITATFEFASRNIHGILNRWYHLCSAEVDPMKKLREQQTKIEVDIVQAWRIQVSKVFGKKEELRLHINEYSVKRDEQHDPFADVETKRPRQATSQGEISVSKRQKR